MIVFSFTCFNRFSWFHLTNLSKYRLYIL
jgi:hypothetical protein